MRVTVVCHNTKTCRTSALYGIYGLYLSSIVLGICTILPDHRILPCTCAIKYFTYLTVEISVEYLLTWREYLPSLHLGEYMRRP